MKKLLSILMVFTLALVLLGTSKTYAYATGSNMFDQTTITSRTPYESGSEYYLQLPPAASGAYSLDNNNISNADIGLLENVTYTLSATGRTYGSSGDANMRLTIWYTNGTLDTRYSTAFGLTDERLSVTFTPDSGKVVDRIVLSGGNIGAHDLLIRKDSIMIEEGSTMSPYIAFGEVAAPINLLRPHHLEYISNQGGALEYKFINIPVKANTDYTFSISSDDAVAWNGVTFWVNGNGGAIIVEDEDWDTVTAEYVSYTFNTGSNTIITSIRQAVGMPTPHADLAANGIHNMQLEEGTLKTTTVDPYSFDENENLLDPIYNTSDDNIYAIKYNLPIEANTDYVLSVHVNDIESYMLDQELWIFLNNGATDFEDMFTLVDGNIAYHSFNSGAATNIDINSFQYDGNVIDIYDAKLKLEEGLLPTGYVNFIAEVPSITSTSAVIYSDIENPYSLAQINATVTAADNQDGDLTSSLTIDASDFIGNEATLGTYTIDYSVMDSDGHTTVFSLQVRVIDVDIPIITLIGAPTINIEFGGTYTEPGANTTDNVDGVMNEVINGNVNISVLGTYQVTYNATDSSGHDAVERTRTVIIEDTTAPTLTGDTTLNLFATESRTVEELIAEEFTANDLHGITESYIEDDFYTGNETVPGTYTFDIVLSDSSGNDFAQTITIVVTEDAAPVITTTLPIMTIEEADALTPEEIRALFGK